MGESVTTTKSDALKTQVIVKLTMLIGACRVSRITKKDIEKSLEQFIKELERQP